jgi:hypothetical protein
VLVDLSHGSTSIPITISPLQYSATSGNVLPMSSPITALKSGVTYLAKNPLTLAKMARHAVGLRLTVPLDLLRWLIAQRPGKMTDVVIGADAPAITFAATVDLMGARLRFSAAITIDEVRLGEGELVIALRIGQLVLTALDGEQSPLGQMLKSGMIDPKRPANALNFMPQKPAVIVEAKDDRFVIDLMKNKKLAGNRRLRAALAALQPLVSIREVRAEGDNLLIGLDPHPMGAVSAFSALVAALR